MSPFHRASARPRFARLAGLLTLLLLASLAPMGSGLAAAATPVTVGYKDFSYAEAPGGDDVTADRSQSKLWTHDGRWFGIMFDPGGTPELSAKYRIWRFDMSRDFIRFTHGSCVAASGLVLIVCVVFTVDAALG